MPKFDRFVNADNPSTRIQVIHIISKLFVLLLPILFLVSTASAQEMAPMSYPKNFIHLKLGADDPWVGVGYERLLTKNIGAEVQLGLIGAAIGAKLYFPAMRSGRLNFHVGVMPGWGFAGGPKTYFPIGLNYLTNNDFRFSIDAGPRIWHDEDEENFLGFSLKIGKGF
jgi:hypothetical protein